MSDEISRLAIPMIIFIAISIATAARPDKERKRNLKEEETMQYSEEDLKNEWEFKIVRADMAFDSQGFHKPEKFKKLVEEEQRSGWILLEKLDDSRVRFKRRRSAQANDAELISNGIDPYRTLYTTQGNIAIMRGLVVMALIFLFVILFVFIVRPF